MRVESAGSGGEGGERIGHRIRVVGDDEQQHPGRLLRLPPTLLLIAHGCDGESEPKSESLLAQTQLCPVHVLTR